VADKKYGECPCAKAICDIEAMMMVLERLRCSCDVDAATTVFDEHYATDCVATHVRQLVTDSKNLVAGALSSSSDREARLRILVDATMHTLAAVFLHCCRLVAYSSSAVDRPSSPGVAANVADNLMEAARSLRTTIDAVRAVLDAGSDAAAIDRSKNALLATAASLAKSLSVLVQEVKTV